MGARPAENYRDQQGHRQQINPSHRPVQPSARLKYPAGQRGKLNVELANQPVNRRRDQNHRRHDHGEKCVPVDQVPDERSPFPGNAGLSIVEKGRGGSSHNLAHRSCSIFAKLNPIANLPMRKRRRIDPQAAPSATHRRLRRPARSRRIASSSDGRRSLWTSVTGRRQAVQSAPRPSL